MKKNKHPLTSQRGFGRTTSLRPGLTAPVAISASEISAGSGPSGKTRMSRRFGRKMAPAAPASVVKEKKSGA
jgi:hypothetical protein